MNLRDSSGIQLAKALAKRLRYFRHELLTARPPRHDDLYIVSFPKSGATWLNFLMANLHLRASNIDRTVTFFNVHDIIPDIGHTRDIPTTLLPFPGYRVIKSHAEYNPYYQKVIYVVRDPRDVMVSYFHFLRGLGVFHEDFASLVRSTGFGVKAWCRHVQGWFELSQARQSFSFLKYEDLLADTRGTIQKVYRLLGHELSDALVNEAVELSSFDQMRKSEEEYGYGGRDFSRTLKFMRKGEAGGWKGEIAQDDRDHVQRTAAKWMARFGYQ